MDERGVAKGIPSASFAHDKFGKAELLRGSGVFPAALGVAVEDFRPSAVLGQQAEVAVAVAEVGFAQHKSAQPDFRHLLLLVAEVAHLILVVAPAFLDLDPKFEVNLGVQHTLDVGAGLTADFLEHCALLADDCGSPFRSR